jgi:hypothetical protein
VGSLMLSRRRAAAAPTVGGASRHVAAAGRGHASRGERDLGRVTSCLEHTAIKTGNDGMAGARAGPDPRSTRPAVSGIQAEDPAPAAEYKADASARTRGQAIRTRRIDLPPSERLPEHVRAAAVTAGRHGARGAPPRVVQVWGLIEQTAWAFNDVPRDDRRVDARLVERAAHPRQHAAAVARAEVDAASAESSGDASTVAGRATQDP